MIAWSVLIGLVGALATWGAMRSLALHMPSWTSTPERRCRTPLSG